MGSDRAPWICKRALLNPALLLASILTKGSSGSKEGSVASPSQTAQRLHIKRQGTKQLRSSFKAK